MKAEIDQHLVLHLIPENSVEEDQLSIWNGVRCVKIHFGCPEDTVSQQSSSVQTNGEQS